MRPILDLLAPPRCVTCRVPHHVPWCPRCLAAAETHRLVGPCPRCASPVGSDPHGCWPETSPVASTTALYRYRGVVADTVVASKLRGASAVWPALGVRLAEQLPRHARTVDAVTAVPTEPRRRKHRGFDHAWLFARGVAAQLHIPAVATLEARRGARDQGAIASIDERQQLPPGTFEASRSLAGANLLLVDDVLTTGATFTAAVSALAEAGATAVHLAALARAGAHPLDGRGHRGDDHESGPSHRVPR